MSARTRLMAWLAVLAGFAVAPHAGLAASLRVEPPPGLAMPPIEVSPWTAAEDGAALRLGPSGEAELDAGDYALRIIGTDHRYGPVRLGSEDDETVRLAAYAVTAPAGAAPTALFLLDAATGAAAARLTGDGKAAAVWPGRYELVRDLATERLGVTLGPGEAGGLAFGAIMLRAPASVGDFAYYAIAGDDGIAAFARFHGGAQPLPPGRYRLLREGGGITLPVIVAAGETTTVDGAALEVRAIGGGSPGYKVLSADRAAPVLSASAGEQAQFLLPAPEPLRLVANAAPDSAADAATGFTPLPGRVARFWMRADGTFLPAAPDGELAVAVAANASGYVAAGGTLPVRVALDEAAMVTLHALGGAGLDQPGAPTSAAAQPPAAELVVTVPDEPPTGGLFQVEAEARLASGLVLKGRSGVYPVAPPLTATVGAVTVEAVTVTTVTLAWTAADDPRVAGYNVYRLPRGALPVNGEVPIAEPGFAAIGLSAGRAYSYTVCATDRLGIEGPCSAPISAETPVIP